MYFFSWIDKKIFEDVITHSEFDINNRFNISVNNSINYLIKKNNLSAKKFYDARYDSSGNMNFLSANTILMNQICSELAVLIPQNFSKQSLNIIKIPIGTIFSYLTKNFYLSSMGPSIKLKIIPLGNALVDFESKFTSAGINQTNFNIWLNIKFNSEIINPLQQKEIIFNKKISLVNTIINGSVPNALFK